MIAYDRSALYREGKLDELRHHLERAFRSDPANATTALELFELGAVMGQWARCLNQLELLSNTSTEASWMLEQVYAPCAAAEMVRAEVFAGRRPPLLFGEPPDWVALLTEFLRVSVSDKPARGRELLLEALEAAPEVAGTINGESFRWIRDADARVAPLIEAFVGGKYYWVPLEHIQAIRIEEPNQVRDLVWARAHFTWVNGGSATALIPSRYPGSESNEDNEIRLAYRTEWQESNVGFPFGLGQRVFMLDGDRDVALLETREIELTTSPEADGPAASPGA